jgi:hypothetical protein
LKIIILDMKKNNLILTIFAIFVILVFQVIQVEASVSVLLPPSVLPTARGMTTAIWDGSNSYIFGGWDTWFLDDIVRFNPSTGTVTLLPSPSILPTARYATSAIWDGSNVYIFGGGTPSGYLDDIVQFNPSTDTVTLLSSPSVLPTPRSSTSAIWDGNNAYIFGGSDSSGYLNEIVRFNPTTGVVTVLPFPSVLPTARAWTSAIWDGSNAYIFGGINSGGLLNDIVRFNPTTSLVTLMENLDPAIKLPTARWLTSAIWDGSNAYIFGGDETDGVPAHIWLNDIIQFNPTAVRVLPYPDKLPTGRGVTSAIWDGRNAYIFGGADDYSDTLNDIVLFYPPKTLIGKQSAVVGGFMMPVNKFAILAPYMALLIFFEITLAVYIIRLKRKT